ncbi:type II toxin-antitoxin system VapC family toxin [Romeria aff. gracilis LEGE 07310]|uniref:Type II toxin-antitoxin system VapC family toxin n=1 Tax=Vasconcelosia minhoensis LEGE 07310 TaxID=915328 RepID=A0A8J7AIE5_9CYAN|nr:type II toxin-antitoxin system VapC family toxin [Romeria gracilis]MBE9079544.1 type II toxin-antitoxin system VapC family toxin [Romeria aff. gracilis LEGE 07310]
MTAVLDASALLAFLLDEPGQDQVDDALSGATISAVNWSEVLQLLVRRGEAVDGCRNDLEALGLSIVTFDAETAETAAQLWLEGRPYGLSLGDRACIALGKALEGPILTADQIWATAFPNLPIQLIR